MEQKELWPGAGLWLNLQEIKDGDFDKIEARIDEIASTSDKILWLERFLILFNEATDRALDEGYGHLDVRALMTPIGDSIQRFINARTTFKYRVWSRLETLKSLHEVEVREEETKRDEQEDDQTSGKWTNEHAAVALYALRKCRAAALVERRLGGVVCGRAIRVYLDLSGIGGMRHSSQQRYAAGRNIIAAVMSSSYPTRPAS